MEEGSVALKTHLRFMVINSIDIRVVVVAFTCHSELHRCRAELGWSRLWFCQAGNGNGRGTQGSVCNE